MKYQFEESIKEVLQVKKGSSDAINQKIITHAAAEKSRHRSYLYPGRPAACAAIAILVLLTSGISISYAAGAKPVQTILDRFTKMDKKVISQNAHEGKTAPAAGHNLTLDEYYLDVLGNGCMAFSLTKKDGSAEKDLALGNSIKAYYMQNGNRKEFVSYDASPIRSEQDTSLDGIQLSFYGSEFPADGGDIVMKIGKETFTFPDIRSTQKHYYEWKNPEGSVLLSSVGILTTEHTAVCHYFDRIIGTEEDEGAIATVSYQDGSQDSLQLSGFFGVENAEIAAGIHFSPWTELQKHLEEGWTWEEVKEELHYNFSIYTFSLDEMTQLRIGDVVLDVKDAVYH